ncbi:hypothetical protein VTN96DRAFT_4260 [Rasamsonia emersonii]
MALAVVAAAASRQAAAAAKAAEGWSLTSVLRLNSGSYWQQQTLGLSAGRDKLETAWDRGRRRQADKAAPWAVRAHYEPSRASSRGGRRRFRFDWIRLGTRIAGATQNNRWPAGLRARLFLEPHPSANQRRRPQGAPSASTGTGRVTRQAARSQRGHGSRA